MASVDSILGDIDIILSRYMLDLTVEGLGFDAVVGSVKGTMVRGDGLKANAGARLFAPPQGTPDDLWWMPAVVNFDDGNVARFTPARDAAETGETRGGLEALVPWASLWPDGLPEGGTEMAVFASLIAHNMTPPSNQALPPYLIADPPPYGTIPVDRVVRFAVDAAGGITVAPAVTPAD